MEDCRAWVHRGPSPAPLFDLAVAASAAFGLKFQNNYIRNADQNPASFVADMFSRVHVAFIFQSSVPPVPNQFMSFFPRSFQICHIRRSLVQHSTWLQCCQCIKAQGISHEAPEHPPLLIHRGVDIRVNAGLGSLILLAFMVIHVDLPRGYRKRWREKGEVSA